MSRSVVRRLRSQSTRITTSGRWAHGLMRRPPQGDNRDADASAGGGKHPLALPFVDPLRSVPGAGAPFHWRVTRLSLRVVKASPSARFAFRCDVQYRQHCAGSSGEEGFSRRRPPGVRCAAAHGLSQTSVALQLVEIVAEINDSYERCGCVRALKHRGLLSNAPPDRVCPRKEEKGTLVP